jgi:hypothetical protein
MEGWWREKRGYYLAESIEDVVEVQQNLALCDFGDVVHALARVVSHTGILVGEAGEHGRHDLVEVAGDFLWAAAMSCQLPATHVCMDVYMVDIQLNGEYIPAPRLSRQRPAR